MSGLQRLLHRTGQIGPHGVQVDRVLQPGRERSHRLVRVIASPVEPPVDGTPGAFQERYDAALGVQGQAERDRVAVAERLALAGTADVSAADGHVVRQRAGEDAE